MALQIYGQSYSGPKAGVLWRMTDHAGRWFAGGYAKPANIADLISFQLYRLANV